jgi:hypothetical protein
MRSQLHRQLASVSTQRLAGPAVERLPIQAKNHRRDAKGIAAVGV